MNRRQFLQGAAGFPAIITVRTSLSAADYDLVIRGGRVIDPAQRMDRVADVAIRGGKIAAVGKIPQSAARESIDAAGKLVTPGLIDVHVHARDAELPPAEFLKLGDTSLIDAGSRGADNVDQIIDIARAAPNRLRVLLNIARLGNSPNGRAEFLDGIEPADVAKAKAAIAKHRDYVIGIKARLSRNIAVDLDMEVLRRAIEAATPSGIPIMIHMGDTFSPLPKLLAIMRPGDIVSHMYAPTPHGIMDENGKVLPEVREARRRGIRFDFGHGLNGHWDWKTAESGLKQGFPPDTISTDLNVAGRTEQVIDLPNVLSKFLLMGMPLNQVLACVTANAAQSFRAFRGLGTLRAGTPADLTVLELEQGNFSFVDNYKTTRMGPQRLATRAVVMGGKRIV